MCIWWRNEEEGGGEKWGGGGSTFSLLTLHISSTSHPYGRRGTCNWERSLSHCLWVDWRSTNGGYHDNKWWWLVVPTGQPTECSTGSCSDKLPLSSSKSVNGWETSPEDLKDTLSFQYANNSTCSSLIAAGPFKWLISVSVLKISTERKCDYNHHGQFSLNAGPSPMPHISIINLKQKTLNFGYKDEEIDNFYNKKIIL